ncbi:MAG: glycosyltransferase family 4 protein [Candidatus Marinimicrobia bacterium]|nr:glycosyltransferase family 4 protein [Candidatus Neomarinimicrobiota bacterium]
MIARVFLAHQINRLVDFYDVTIISNMSNYEDVLDNISNKVNVVSLPIERNINLFADIKALFLLVSLFRSNNFSLVHSVSPKAGLLSAIAGWTARVPNRVHTFTGQVWATKNGFSRWALKLLDKLIVRINTEILVDSHSQQEFLIKESVLSINNSTVLGNGSICGVDTKRFSPSLLNKKIIRNKLNIDQDDVVILYVGRLKEEKGVVKLANAFLNISKKNKNISMVIVGPDEENLKEKLVQILNVCIDSVRFIGFTKKPEHYMMASDILILPSYREGFGNVIIEAASIGIPSIVTDIYGLNDSIVNGETGLLTSVNSNESMEDAMDKLVKDKSLRIKMGNKARLRASEFFSQEFITLKVIRFYKRLL